MGKKLIITEKPSVATAIAEALGISTKHKGYYENEKYLCTWAFGHLLGLGSPEEQNKEWGGEWTKSQLPMLPEKFRYVVLAKTKSQLETIKKLVHRSDVDEVINAGDDGREGELIQREILMACGNRHPVMRLRRSSMDEKTIREGFSKLVPANAMDNVFYAARARSEADWKIGMNISRLAAVENKSKDGSNLYGFSFGRVQIVMVELVNRRNDEVSHFVPAPYYTVKAVFDREYWGTLLDDDGKIMSYSTPQEADELIGRLKGADGKVIGYEVKKRQSQRPHLYRLSTLQVDAGRKYGFSPKETLEIAQQLYDEEGLKCITYPRTDSEYLTENMREEIPTLIEAIKHNGYPVLQTPLANGPTMDEHIFNDKKVSDHHAIIINSNYRDMDKSRLTKKQFAILDLIIKRMMLAFSPQYVYNQTMVTTSVAGEVFRSTGETALVLGWRETAQILGIKKNASTDSQFFGNLREGDSVKVISLERQDKMTTPPKEYTQADLIDTCVNAYKLFNEEDSRYKKLMKLAEGIGTEASRADILYKILDEKHYIEKRGKREELFVTQKGKAMLRMSPEQLKDVLFTAEWESKFTDIEKGRIQARQFQDEIDRFITDTVNDYKGILVDVVEQQSLELSSVLGKCPKCGADFVKGKFGPYCKKKCGFILKQYRKKQLTDSQIKKLLEGKEVSIKNIPKKDKEGTYGMKICPTGNLVSYEYNGSTYYSLELKEEWLN